MTRSQADDWSIARSLAFLAATFAIVFGSLMPFAALAASTPGNPITICSAEGAQTLSIGVDGAEYDKGPKPGMGGAKCAACLLSVAAALPDAPLILRAAGLITRPASIFIAAASRVSPPARAPPRPPSTAPPQA